MKIYNRNKLPVMMAILSICLTWIHPVDGAAEARKENFKERQLLNGDWKITVSDRPEYCAQEYDDTAWDRIVMPGSFFGYALEKTGKLSGIVWLRKTVVIDAGSGRPAAAGLILGRIANADETYFNGERIGGMGRFLPHDNAMWNHPRHYLVPGKLINGSGNNVIAVRISYNVFAEMNGTLALTNLADWDHDRVRQTFSRVTAGYIMIAMGLPFLVIFLVFYILRRDEEYLYYCLQLVFGVLIVLELCNHWNTFGNSLMRLKVLGFSWAAINVVHPIFLHRIYGLQRKKTEWALWSYLVSMAVLLLTITGSASDRFQAVILIAVTTCIGFYNISCHISAMYRKKRYAILFSFFGIGVVLGAMHDGLVYLSKFSDHGITLFGYAFRDFMIFHYMVALLYTGTALLLVFRFIHLVSEVEDLNNGFENFIIENALLNKQLTSMKSAGKKISADSPLTVKSEEKLRKVVAFVNENYQSDISREGLAASVDVHPDNLGKLFRKYTSKKLGDYICELRIEEAARRIKEGDGSIIDIAYSTGFESLRTFNRAFLKVKKMTPAKYKKAH